MEIPLGQLDKRVFEILAHSFPKEQHEHLKTASEKILLAVSSEPAADGDLQTETNEDLCCASESSDMPIRNEQEIIAKTAVTEKEYSPMEDELVSENINAQNESLNAKKNSGHSAETHELQRDDAKKEGREVENFDVSNVRHLSEGIEAKCSSNALSSEETFTQRDVRFQGSSNTISPHMKLEGEAGHQLPTSQPQTPASINGTGKSEKCSKIRAITKVPTRWTDEQDDMLRRGVGIHGARNWKAVAAMVPDRDHVQCLQRWNKVLQPGLVKGPWTPEEDRKLIQLATDLSKNWALISHKIPGRTAKQCRERWKLNLDPSINHAPFTAEEDDLLLRLRSELGNRWAEIKLRFKGRTENAVKTRFKSLMRSKAREWNDKQDEELLSLLQMHGHKYDTIAACLENRTAAAVKLRVKKLLKGLGPGLQINDSFGLASHSPSSEADSQATDLPQSIKIKRPEIKSEKQSTKRKGAPSRSPSSLSSAENSKRSKKARSQRTLSINTKSPSAGDAQFSPFSSVFTESPLHTGKSSGRFSAGTSQSVSPRTTPGSGSFHTALQYPSLVGISGVTSDLQNVQHSSVPPFSYYPNQHVGFDYMPFQDFEPICTPRSSFPPSPRNLELPPSAEITFDPSLSPSQFFAPYFLSTARGSKQHIPGVDMASTSSDNFAYPPLPGRSFGGGYGGHFPAPHSFLQSAKPPPPMQDHAASSMSSDLLEGLF